MKQDTADFLNTLLWLAEDGTDFTDVDLRGKTVHDFSDKFVEKAEAFVDGFREHLRITGFDMEKLELLECSFGGNVYLSLSGHGAGFFDDNDSDLSALHGIIKKWAGTNGRIYRFEELEYSLDLDKDGKIDLSYIDSAIDEQRDALFSITKPEINHEQELHGAAGNHA